MAGNGADNTIGNRCNGDVMLKRKIARLCILLYAAAIALCLLGTTITFFSETLGIISLFVAIAAPVAAVVIGLIFLRCKSCGLTVARLQWSSNREFYCCRCGEQYKYDK